MAGQRRGESRRHGGGGRPRPRGLGLRLSLALILLAGCGGDADGPDPFDPGRDRTGRSGAGTAGETLVGTWRNVIVVQVPGDVQTWTTIWRFGSDGGCQQTVETESLVEGFPRTTERACTYLTSVGTITIAYAGGGSLTFDYFFASFSPDRLVLDGFEYERIT